MATETGGTRTPARTGTAAGLARVGLARLSAVGDDALTVVRLQRGEALLHAGGEVDAVYALLTGRLLVRPGTDNGREPTAIELAPGSILGETALLAGGRRTGTVVAACAARLVRIEAERFTELLEKDRVLARTVADEARSRLRRLEFSRHVPHLLGHDDLAAISALEERCTWVHLPAGTTLFGEGEHGDAAYLVLSGRLAARQEGQRRHLGEIGPGELVGETALLDGGRRTASVVAVRDSELARLDRETLDKLLQDHPGAGLAVVRQAVRRATRPHARGEQRTTLSVAVVPLSPSVDLRVFTSGLAQALEAHGPTAHLWSARIDSLLGKAGASQRAAEDPAGIRLTTWLHETEARARSVVYEVDSAPSAWSHRALRWADVVLFVGDGDAAPERSELTDGVWTSLADHPRRTALALLHAPSAARPRDTATWLTAHPVDEVHHLRGTSPAELARLGRLVSGTAMGVALSGGGARGFAHLGVLKALEEASVPVDVVGGTSMGAIVASGWAMGLPADELIGLAARRFRKVLDYTMPFVSMVKGRRIVQGMRATYEDRDIEDLWRTFFCVSANLTRSETVVHRRGRLVDAVRASVAIPGVIPPVPHDGDLLVDGGVLNNLPLDELLATGLVGTAIAVDVTPKDGPRAKADFGLSVSGLGVLTGRLRGRRHPAPGITRVLLRSMILGAMRDRDLQARQAAADLFLDLDLRGIDMLDFHAVERVAAAGYEASAPRIQAWLEEAAA